MGIGFATREGVSFGWSVCGAFLGGETDVTTRGYSSVVTACLLISVTLLMGCEGAPLAEGESLLPYPDVRGRPRSIVFNSRELRRVSVAPGAGFNVGGQPWYASRNDIGLTTFAGYRSAKTERVVNITYDRQTISAGRVRDHFHNTTYRQSVTHVVR